MAYAATFQVRVKPAGSWVTLAASNIISLGDIDSATGGSAAEPFAFGDSSQATASLKILASALPSPWRNIPIEITYGIDASSQVQYLGTIATRRGDGDTVELTCRGFADVVGATRVYSPLFERRYVATKTTATSIDDPSSGGYAAGPINWILWQAGGRPYEQAASYPSATFYYACDQAILAPPYAWFAGEDGWQEAQRLAQAAGGQLYQDAAGVVRYRQPLILAGQAPSLTITAGMIVRGSYRDEYDADAVFTSMVCPFVPRVLRPTQEILTDDTARMIAPSATITVELESSQPLRSVEQASAGQLPADALTVVSATGMKLTSGYTHTLSTSAQRIVVTVTNGSSSAPIVLTRVVIRGAPIVALEHVGGTVTAGSGARAKTLSDSVYVQRRSDAQRLADMYLRLAAIERPVREITVVPNVPALSIGQTVALTWSVIGASAQRHLVTGLQRVDGGKAMQLRLVPVDDLPLVTDYFRWSTSSQAGLTKKVAV